MELETLKEDEEYNCREVKLPVLLPAVSRHSVREVGAYEQRRGRDILSHSVREVGAYEQRRGRDILIAVDHGPNSKLAFDWAINHLCNFDDTVHLLHAVSSTSNEILYDTSQELMEKLYIQAIKTSLVKCERKIVQGDAGKVICREASRLRPMAVVMGTRGRSLLQSVLKGSVSEYCFHNCRDAPVIIVPGKVEVMNETLV